VEIYFDNSATTRVSDAALALVLRTMQEDYGNPSSRHKKGVQAERYVRTAASQIARTLKVQEKEILFTSGGTESDNLALIGCALANQRSGKHMITTAIEHPAVYEALLFLESMGFEITVLPVDSKGHISLSRLSEAIRNDTILVSVMHVNNEIGAVEPVEEIAGTIRKRNPNTLFHVDAIQSYGKYRIYPKRIGVDLLSVSGHKIHGPKGVGFLYADSRVKLKAISFGGGQQNGMRSGTLNVPGIAGLGAAAEECYRKLEENVRHMATLKDGLIDALTALPGVTVNSGRGMESAPHILSVSVDGVRAEVLLHALEERQIYVSSGSACSSNHPGISGTLKGIGLQKKALTSTIRLSFCETNTGEEAALFVQAMRELLPELRKFTRH
jgi:hypothetical protein